jgi:hypothetical protein
VTRALALLLGGLLLGGAAPRVLLPLPPPLPLPLPPPLPTDPPADEAAPMPDEALRSPGRTVRDATGFALRMYPMQDLGTGEGFIPGSAYQSPEQRKPMQTPGFMVTMPLQ